MYCHHIEPRVQLTCREKNHSLFPRFTLLNETPPRRNIRCGERDWRRAKTSEAKTNSIVLILQGRNSVLYYNFAQEFVPMKSSQDSSSLNFLWRWKQAHVVSSRGTAYLWDKNSSSDPKSLGKYEILSSVNLGRKKHELRMWFWSANFGNRELRMVQKTLEICLSETHASGNREVRTKDLSHQAMLIPDAKATMEKEWKEVIKKAHKNKR